jgi:hypothetical protein
MADVKQSNPNAFAELELKLKQLDGFQTKVGWFDEAKYDDGTPVAYVAAIQEKGYGPIPPRPFMRPAQIDNEQKWKETAGFAANKVLDGSYTGKDAMDLLGSVATGDIIKAISDVLSPPLSLITLMARKYRKEGKKVTGRTIGEIARRIKKGDVDISGVSTKPLVDTGKMIATVTHLTESTR